MWGFLRPYKKRYDNSNVKCYNCQRFGQYTSECKNVVDIVEEKANYIEKKEKTKNIKVHGILILALAIICVVMKDVYRA